MSSTFELEYKKLLLKILKEGETRQTRNAKTKALFAQQLVIDIPVGKFPLITGRKMWYKGILGELAAMIRGPKSVKDFEDQGCNYWKLWGNPDGSINVDYGNTWINFNGSGVNQLQRVIDTIKTNPTDRRLLIVGTNPANTTVSLPSCHILYQFFVREEKYLDMMWTQRSLDSVIGTPSDFILAYVLNMLIAKDTGLLPGKITMNIGDTHIYENHWESVNEYIEAETFDLPDVIFSDSYTDIWNFTQNDLIVTNYNHSPAIKFELLA